MALENYQIQFGDLVIGTDEFGLKTFEPFNSPAIRSSDVDKPLDHGEFPGIDLMKGRSFTLVTEAWLRDTDEILRAFVPGQEKLLQYRDPSLGLVSCRCRVRNRIGPRTDISTVLGKAVITIQFYASDPRWYGPESTLATGTVTSDTNLTLPSATQADYAQLGWFNQWYHIANKNNTQGWQTDRPTYDIRRKVLREETGLDRENIHIVTEDSDFEFVLAESYNLADTISGGYSKPGASYRMARSGLWVDVENNRFLYTSDYVFTPPRTSVNSFNLNTGSHIEELFELTTSDTVNSLYRRELTVLDIISDGENYWIAYRERRTNGNAYNNYVRCYNASFSEITSRRLTLPSGGNHNQLAIDVTAEIYWVVGSNNSTYVITAYDLSDSSINTSESLTLPTDTSAQVMHFSAITVTADKVYMYHTATQIIRVYLKSNMTRLTSEDFDVSTLVGSDVFSGMRLVNGVLYIMIRDDQVANDNASFYKYNLRSGPRLNSDYVYWEEFNNNTEFDDINVLKVPDPAQTVVTVPFGHDNLPDYLVWYNADTIDTWVLGIDENSKTPFDPPRHSGWKRWVVDISDAPTWVDEDTFYGIGRRATQFQTNQLRVFNRGNINAFFIARIYGTISNATILLNGRTIFSISGSIAEGDFVYINSATREVLINGDLDESIYERVIDPFALTQIPIGTHTLTLLGHTLSDAARLELIYKDAWV